MKAHETSVLRHGSDYARHRAAKISYSAIRAREIARQDGMLARYGVSNPSQLAETHDKRRCAYAARTPEQRAATRLKNMTTRIARGTSVPEHDPTVFSSKKAYTRRVRQLTNLNVRALDLFPGRSIGLHVDHKVSILQGYRDKVLPSVIAHPLNLQLLPASANSKKNSRSSMTLQELHSLIEASTSSG